MINPMNRPRQSILDTFNIPKTVIKFTDPDDASAPAVLLGSVNLYDGDEFYLSGEDDLIIEQSLAYGSFYWVCYVTVEYCDGTSQDYTVSGGGQTVIHTKSDIKQITITRSESSMSNTIGYLMFEPITHGIFDAMNTVIDSISGSMTMPDGMDIDYFLEHAGTKASSNIVHLMTQQNGYGDRIKHLDYSDRVKLAQSIIRRYYDSWVKIYDALMVDYNPIENYSMQEETTPDLTDTFGVSDDYERSTQRTTKSRVTTEQEDVTNDGSVYGFNSASAVPATKNVSNGTVTVSADDTDNVDTATETQVGERVETHTGSTTVTRSGNIGVTTSQQMLQSEIDLRVKNHMEDIIFADVDQILTIAGFAPVLSDKINLI